MFARVGLRLLGFRRTYRAATRRVAPGGDPNREELDSIAQAIARASFHSPFRPTCLERSLALLWMLGRRGVAGTLRFGVRKSGGTFEAHAWVESQGAIVGGVRTELPWVPLPPIR